jgi:hypothetical protein
VWINKVHHPKKAFLIHRFRPVFGMAGSCVDAPLLLVNPEVAS